MSKKLVAALSGAFLLSAAAGLAVWAETAPAAPEVMQPKAAPAQSASPAGAAAALASLNVDMPYTRYVLPNGLTLIVHTDTTAPVVHFNIWYHVGSKNEPQGQSGFAHLFEHLMFQGSENFNDDYFKATRQIGATQQNGTTSSDRTNYFQTVPKEALDAILWLESDRMGHFLGVVDQARLDEQRGVVQNEKRQGDNSPYAIAQDLIIRATYPEEHPYGHSVIGSLDDLDAASLEQVKDWFRKYYGPSNAVVVLSGDITPEQARAKVEQYFGWIPPGEPVAHPKAWVVRRTGEQREVAYDRVATPRLYKIWNVAQYGHPSEIPLDVYAEVLTADRSSRLTRRLVYEEQIATSVSAGAGMSEIAGRFQVVANGRPGADMARIERIIDEEMAKLIAEGPTAAELEKVRARNVAGVVRSLEGINTKASMLATGEVYLGDAGSWKTRLDQLRNTTAAQVQAAAREWLTDGSYTLTILPFDYRPSTADVDRSRMPTPAAITPGAFPSFQRARLSNGIEVLVAERHQAPIVSVDLLVDTGYATNFAEDKVGVGGLAASLMNQGTQRRDTFQLSEELTLLGAQLSVAGGGERTTVSLNALKPTLDQALDVFSDVTLNPAFRQADVDRVKAQEVAGLRSARLNPGSIAPRVLSRIVYGENHPYGRLETEAAISSITRDELAGFHQRWFAPQNAAIVVVGDTTVAEIMPKLERALGSWRSSSTARRANPPMPATPARPTIYIVDRPGSPQSYIMGGMPAAPRDPRSDQEFQLNAFNTGFGGNFTSRINMNLREDKGWSYGVSSAIAGGRGPRNFRITAQIQTDKTKESLQELLNELDFALQTRPLTAQEIAVSQNNTIMGLSSRWQSSGAVSGALAEIQTYGLPDTYYQTYPDKIRAVTPEQTLAAGRALVPSRNFSWVVVGDRARIEPGLRELGMDVKIVDADGNPV